MPYKKAKKAQSKKRKSGIKKGMKPKGRKKMKY